MLVLRPARAEDAVALAALEKRANLVALAHVYPPERHPFPDDGVLARWEEVLAADDVVVEVLEEQGTGDAALVAYLAHDARTVRRLAVDPTAQGRGHARRLLERAVERIRRAGLTPRLWCLEQNTVALGLYRHLGWRRTGRSRPDPWPPQPTLVELVLDPVGGSTG